MNTWRSLVALLLLMGGLSAFGQTASRWDWQAWTINNGNPSPNGLYPVLAIPGATISICSGNPCTLATSYTDATAITPCDPTTQLTRGTSTACYGVADDQGGFGAWLLPGTYQYTISTNWGTFGPFPFGVDAAGAYCPISGGCTITGNLTVTGTINGVYSCAPTSTLAQCLALLPDTGGTLQLQTGTYQAGSFSPCISTPNVTILGAGTPQFNSGSTALSGATIVQGRIPVCGAPNFALSNLGVDVGSDWVAGGHSATDGLIMEGANNPNPSDPIVDGARIFNVVFLGAGAGSPFHGALIEHYKNVWIVNVESRNQQHCIAIKSINVSAVGIKYAGCSTDGIAVKGDGYTKLVDVSLVNILGRYLTTPGDTGNGIVIEAAESTGTVSRVTVDSYTTNGVLTDIALTNSSGVGTGALSGVSLHALNFYKINTSAGTPTIPTCMVSSGSSFIDRVHVSGLLCNINDPGQAVAPLTLDLSLTNSALDDLTFIGSGFASDIEGTVTINGIRDYGAATSQKTIFAQVSSATRLYITGWSSTRGNIPFDTNVGAIAYVSPSSITMNSANGATVNVNGALNAQQIDTTINSSSDVYNAFANSGSGGLFLQAQANSYAAFQSITSSGCWIAGPYGTADYGILDCSGGGLPDRVVDLAKNAPSGSFSILSSGVPTFPAIFPSGCVQVDGSGHLSSTGVGCGGGGGAGVASINSQTGAFTFTGPGVSCTGTTCTFTGTGVNSVSGTAPVVSSGGSTPAISMPAATNGTDGYLTAADHTTFAAKQSALPSPVTITISSFAAAPNSCYGNTGTLNTPTTTTMTGLTTSMAPHWSFVGDPRTLVGWGSTGGITLNLWPSSSNTLSSEVCNVTPSTITISSLTLNVEP